MTITPRAQALFSELVSRGLEPQAIAFASAERYAALRALPTVVPAAESTVASSEMPASEALFAGYPGAVIVALPYDPRPVAPPSGMALPLAVGAFAASHRYATLARILKGAALAFGLGQGYTKRDFRFAVNSSLHEKALAAVSGLAFIGRSSLALTEAYGPACILGALLLPFDPLSAGGDAPAAGASDSVAGDRGAPSADELARRLRQGALCHACRACARACPTGAIRLAEGDAAASSLELGLCIQCWASRGEQEADAPEPPELVLRAWGSRLYGCDECVRACPYSAGAYEPRDRSFSAGSSATSADSLAVDGERVPGPFVDGLRLLGASEEAIKALFKGSALGFAWLGPAAILRNARRAASADRAIKEPSGI